MIKLLVFLLLPVALNCNLVFAADNADTKDTKADSKESATTTAPAPTNKRNDIDEILEGMGYPELQVVPRASDRVAMEARSENGAGWLFEHWPVEISGLATAFVGFTGPGNRRTGLNSAQVSEANTISSVTAAVGVGWVVGGILLGADKPYKSAQSTIQKYPGKDERSSLMRERMAEEALERPAKIIRVLQYFAVATNVAVDGLSIIYANNGGRIDAGVGVTLAFLPILFQDHSIDIYEKQIEYKKKIYSPIKTVSFSYDPYHRTMTPIPALAWTF